MSIKLTGFLIAFASAIICVGQSRDSTILYYAGQIHYGFVIPHSESIRSLVRGVNPWSMSVEISRLRHTKAAWKACNCYSQNGISLSYFNFDKTNVFGRSLNLTFFVEPQLSLNKFNLSLRAGLGLSYLTKVYDEDTNPDNVLFSSPLSGLILLQLNGRLWLNNQWAIRISAAYHHISNGGISQPNLGMNFPTFGATVEYAVGRTNLSPLSKSNIAGDDIRYYGGLHITSRNIPDHEGRGLVVGITGGVLLPFARMHAAGVALEFVNDWSLKVRNELSDGYIDHRIVSLLARHHFLFGKFDFSQSLGVYLYKVFPTSHHVFQRYSLMYALSKNLQVGFSIKAHLHVAEQMDVRLNYLF